MTRILIELELTDDFEENPDALGCDGLVRALRALARQGVRVTAVEALEGGLGPAYAQLLRGAFHAGALASRLAAAFR